jgi:hypothetical protein
MIADGQLEARLVGARRCRREEKSGEEGEGD